MQARKAKARMIRIVTWRGNKHMVSVSVIVVWRIWSVYAIQLEKWSVCTGVCLHAVIINGKMLLTEVNGSSRQGVLLSYMMDISRWDTL